ncbi:DUF7288 family protein [Halorientalis halophila]|uniref:DUF7288 family protein n=1 Tax=Halorientalis halophila TaxID=3108499 RepID=UPI0030098086
MGAAPDERGQAFTLEGLIGAIVLLTAVLFALQAINAVPTDDDGGPGAEAEVSAQADDALRMAARNDTFGLSELIRYYAPAQEQYYGAVGSRVGYGDGTPPGQVGRILESTITEQGRTYNLRIRYRNESLSNGWESTPIVRRGEPDETAVRATYTITLYDNQTLTAPTTSGIELQEISSRRGGSGGYYPVPNAVDGPVYNVVEVRLTVW